MPRLALALCLLCLGCGERPPPGSDLRDRVADLKRALADAGSWRSWQAQLEARIAAADRGSWAGEYRGGAENAVIRFWYAPGVGFEWSRDGDSEGVDWGTAEMADGRLHLEPVSGYGERMYAREWVAVRWGARRYLLPSGWGVQGFCNAFARGEEPRTEELGPISLRRGDWNEPVVGLPEMPAPFADCLRSRPIRARITSVDGPDPHLLRGPWGIPRYRVQLDAGSFGGLWEGLELPVRDPAGSALRVTVVAVGYHSAEGVIDDVYGNGPEPAIGWTVGVEPACLVPTPRTE